MEEWTPPTDAVVSDEKTTFVPPSDAEVVEKKNSISQSNSDSGTSELTDVPSGYADRSIGKIKQDNTQALNLDKSNVLKEQMAKDLTANNSPVYKQHYIDALHKKGYDKNALNQFADSLNLPEPKETPPIEKYKKYPGGIESLFPSFIEDYVNNNTKGIEEGLSQVKKGMEKSLLIPSTEIIQGKTPSMKEQLTGLTDIGAGAGKAAFAGANLAVPEMMTFGLSVDAIHKIPDEYKADIALAMNPTSPIALLPKEQQAKAFDKAIDTPFSLVTTIAEASGYEKGKEGREWLDNVMEIGNFLVPVIGHKIGTGVSERVKSMNDLKDLTQRVIDQKATPQDIQDLADINKGISQLDVSDIKNASENMKPEHDELHDKLAELQAKTQEESFNTLPPEVQDGIFNDIKNTQNEIKIKAGEDMMNTSLEAQSKAKLGDLTDKIEQAKASLETETSEPVRASIQNTIDNLVKGLDAIESEAPIVDKAKVEQDLAETKALDEAQKQKVIEFKIQEAIDNEDIAKGSPEEQLARESLAKKYDNAVELEKDSQAMYSAEEGDVAEAFAEPTKNGNDYVYKTPKNEYTLKNENGELTILDKSGKEPSTNTKLKIVKDYESKFDYKTGKSAFEGLKEGEINEAEADKLIADKSENPSEIIEAHERLMSDKPFEKGDAVDNAIADNIGKVKQKGKGGYNNFVDKNNVTMNKAKAYFHEGRGEQIDALAQRISEDTGLDVTPDDIISFIDRHPNGLSDYTKSLKNPLLTSLKDRFKQVTGLTLNDRVLKAFAEKTLPKEDYELISKDYESIEQARESFWNGIESGEIKEPNISSEIADLPQGEKGEASSPATDSEVKLVEEFGEESASVLDVMKRQSNGDAIFGISELDESLVRLNDVGLIENFPTDLLRVVSKEHFDEAIPPTENISEVKTPPENPNYTELTHEAIDKDRKKLGLEPIDKMSYDNAKDFADASAEYKDDHIALAQKLATTRTPATRKQAYIISLGIVDLKAKLKSAENAMNKALEGKDEKAKEDAYVEMGIIEAQLDTAHQALKNATSEAGRVLRLAQDAIREDMSLDSTLRKARAYSKDGKITPEQRTTFENVVKRLEEAEAQLKAHEEELSKIKAQKFVDNIIKEPSEKKTILTRNKAERLSKINELKDKWKSLNNNTDGPVKAGAILSDEHIKIIVQLGAEYIALGATEFRTWANKVKKDLGELSDEDLKKIWKEESIEGKKLEDFALEVEKAKERKEVKLNKENKIIGLDGIVRKLVVDGFTDINEIVKEIKKSVPDKTERQIRDEISGYGKVSELSNDPINVKLREVKRVGKLITQKERALANEELLRSGLQRDKPTAKELEIQKEINDILRENQMKVEQLPKTDAQWKTLLDRYKTRLRNQIDELQAKADRNDYEVKKREATKQDAESLELKRKIDKLKGERAKEIEKIRLANRSLFEKVADTVLKSLRFAILTGVITPALKLGVGAGLVRSAIMTPMETLMTAAWSHLPGLRNIAKQAPRYSGEQIGPLAKGIAEWWSKGTWNDIKHLANVKDLWKGNGGKLEMDILHGKNDQLPATLWEVWGQFHKILKTPAKRAEFKNSFEMNLNWEARQKNELGEYNDITDPVVQLRAASRALVDSDRAIFMQDNPVSTAYKMGLKGLERTMDDGSQGGKIVSKMLQSDMLIVKVPTNFVAESLSYLPGGGALKAATALIARGMKGEINKMTPEQADYISRAVTKQLTGAVLFGIGYYAYKNMGGNYVPGQKNKDKDNKAGDMVIGGIHIPHSLQHSVFAQTLQLGATMAWAEEFYKGKGEPSEVDSYTTMVKSLIRQNPFTQEAEVLTKELNSTNSKQMWAATILQKLTTPAKWFAEHFDTDANGNPIKRSPQTWKEVLEMNIPGLRQNVTTAWDLIDAERSKQTRLQELDAQIHAENQKPNTDMELVRKLKEEKKDIEETNKQDKLTKFEIDEKAYLDLAKALGKVPHSKKSLSKDEKKIENRLKMPK
jgi:hypothetical protein